MKINPLHSNLSFKAHYVNVDIGASSLQGSLKLRMLDENGDTFAEKKGFVFDKDEKRTEKGFEKNVARKIAQFEAENETLIREKDPDNETKLTICYPGSKGVKGFSLSNFCYDDQKTQRFDKPINPKNIDTELKNLGIKITRTRHANDMAGAGSCILRKLQEHDEKVSNEKKILKPGEFIPYLYPGGGLGSGIIAVGSNSVRITPCETQHILKNNSREESIEKNVGAKTLRENFRRALPNVTFEEKEAMGENTMVIDSFEALNDVAPRFTKNEHTIASIIAIEKYMDSLAQLIAIQICDKKVHNIVITGRIANSIRNSINKEDSAYRTPPRLQKKAAADIFKTYDNAQTLFRKYGRNEMPFERILEHKVEQSLSDVGLKIKRDGKKFRIHFVQINDNTEGAELLQKGEEVGRPASWYDIKN